MIMVLWNKRRAIAYRLPELLKAGYSRLSIAGCYGSAKGKY